MDKHQMMMNGLPFSSSTDANESAGAEEKEIIHIHNRTLPNNDAWKKRKAMNSKMHQKNGKKPSMYGST